MLTTDRGNPLSTKQSKSQKTHEKEPQIERAPVVFWHPRVAVRNSWTRRLTRSSSHEASLEPILKRREDLCKHSVYNHFPKDRNWEICQEDQNYKGLVQKTQWRSRISCWKYWWLDNSRSQGSQWTLWISKQSPICSRGFRTWPPNGSRRIRAKNKNFTGTPEKLAKSSWGPRGILKSFTLTIPWNSAKPVKISSWNHCTFTPHRSETNWIAEESSAQSKGRHLCCIVAIRSKLKLVGRFHGMLHPICETSQIYYLMGRRPMKDVWETIKRTDYSIWFNGWVSTL